MHRRRSQGAASSSEDAWIVCDPCIGLPPIQIDDPALYCGAQILVGLACTLVLFTYV
jgi:hypothetical protein